MKKTLLATSMLVVFAAPAMAADPIKLGAVAIQPTVDLLSPSLREVPVAEGWFRYENATKLLPRYGFAGDGPLKPKANAAQKNGVLVEATKTEPDKNTYLVLDGAKGAQKGYHYGTHFLFQGHENGPKDDKGVDHGQLTRINLDADEDHRIT